MAISDTITSMYENVGNVYDVLELAGADLTNVDKNIQNLKQSWEERLLYFLANGTDVVWNNWLPKVTGSGETITLNNTIEAKMNIVYKGNTSQKTTTGKNSFNPIYYKNQEIYTETISISTGNLYCTKLYLKPNTTYTISEALNNWSLDGGWIFVVADTNNQIIRFLQNRPQDYQTTPTTFTTNSDGYVYIGHRYGFTNGGATRILAFLNTVNIQIEEGNTATSFEEYTGKIPSPNSDYPQTIQTTTGNNSITIANNDNTQSQTYPINIGSIELCKIGDYQDKIYKENGKWYLHKEINKIVYTGSESGSWTPSTSGGFTRFAGPIISDTLQTASRYEMKSNYFHYLSSGGEVGAGFIYSGQFFAYPNQTITTEQNFRNWLSNHNTTVYYPLATPTNTEITDTTLISQLEAIKKSYNTQTNISQTNDDKSFILDVVALGELI